MGSGSGSTELTPREEIRGFLKSAITALYEERSRVVVKERTRTKDAGNDHSFPVVTEYRVKFLGLTLKVVLEPPSVTVDRTRLGTEVCDGPLFESLVYACAEWRAFQASDNELNRRQKLEQAKLHDPRALKYARLADKIRGVRPSAKH